MGWIIKPFIIEEYEEWMWNIIHVVEEKVEKASKKLGFW